MKCSVKSKMSMIFMFLLILSLSAFGFGSSATYDASISPSILATKQVQKPCPIDFEKQNYTIITSKCKGPEYPATACCNALKEFACPFARQLNDLSNQCAELMFSYINLNGGYPPGLFANECKGKQGLHCAP